MNVALVLAGGTGTRMHTASIPKQFLECEGKPIIIYTLEKFERNHNIDCNYSANAFLTKIQPNSTKIL